MTLSSLNPGHTRSLVLGLALVSLPLCLLSADVSNTPPATAGGTLTNAAAIHEVLLAADRARGNLDGVIWTVGITATEDDSTKANVYAVKARGFDVLAEVLEPSRQKGNQLLMHLGNMWFSKPDLTKPVTISQRQRLSGSAANGDLAATNYAEDYEPTVTEDAVLDGEACHVFDLKARDRRCTYDRVVHFVSRTRQVGVRSDYYTSTGKLIKTARMAYTNTVIRADGKSLPFISEIFIRDAVATNNVATMSFSPPKLQLLPPETFDVNRLRK
ncbi:MAG: outer membrane lipoprotein-sorting protein [bacterium]